MTSRFQKKFEYAAFECNLGSSKIFISKNDNNKQVDFMILDLADVTDHTQSIQEVSSVEGKATASEARKLAAALQVLAAQLEEEEFEEVGEDEFSVEN